MMDNAQTRIVIEESVCQRPEIDQSYQVSVQLHC